ncbi:MAG: sulfite exporter TauE/SafE family protein [Candidatus Eisenbacteria bacterium]|nr:sulfite exporter TauE/SafE family protein [Candidatus Eisenbacteria bacterium]
MSVGWVSILVFVIAVLMTIAGRGGGNFYVLLQLVVGASMHLAATTGQFLMASTSLAAMIVFQKHRAVVWPMAIFIGLTTSLMAFVGGFISHGIDGWTLKMVFAGMLVLAGILMLLPIREREGAPPAGVLTWRFRAGEGTYAVDLRIAVPVALATGLFAGMVGVSGGSFLVPLMVLACRLPMRLAVGTATVMVAATAFMGFLGHLSRGAFDPVWILPQTAAAIAGGVLGGRLTLRTKPKVLKRIFAITTLAAAVFLCVNAAMTR